MRMHVCVPLVPSDSRRAVAADANHSAHVTMLSGVWAPSMKKARRLTGGEVSLGVGEVLEEGEAVLGGPEVPAPVPWPAEGCTMNSGSSTICGHKSIDPGVG